MNNNVNFCAESRESFIDGVVYDFVYEVVQPVRSGRTDIHCRALSNGFQPFQHFDVFGAVIGIGSWRLHSGVPRIFDSFRHF